MTSDEREMARSEKVLEDIIETFFFCAAGHHGQQKWDVSRPKKKMRGGGSAAPTSLYVLVVPIDNSPFLFPHRWALRARKSDAPYARLKEKRFGPAERSQTLYSASFPFATPRVEEGEEKSIVQPGFHDWRIIFFNDFFSALKSLIKS